MVLAAASVADWTADPAAPAASVTPSPSVAAAASARVIMETAHFALKWSKTDGPLRHVSFVISGTVTHPCAMCHPSQAVRVLAITSEPSCLLWLIGAKALPNQQERHHRASLSSRDLMQQIEGEDMACAGLAGCARAAGQRLCGLPQGLLCSIEGCPHCNWLPHPPCRQASAEPCQSCTTAGELVWAQCRSLTHAVLQACRTGQNGGPIHSYCSALQHTSAGTEAPVDCHSQEMQA